MTNLEEKITQGTKRYKKTNIVGLLIGGYLVMMIAIVFVSICLGDPKMTWIKTYGQNLEQREFWGAILGLTLPVLMIMLGIITIFIKPKHFRKTVLRDYYHFEVTIFGIEPDTKEELLKEYRNLCKYWSIEPLTCCDK